VVSPKKLGNCPSNPEKAVQKCHWCHLRPLPVQQWTPDFPPCLVHFYLFLYVRSHFLFFGMFVLIIITLFLNIMSNDQIVDDLEQLDDEDDEPRHPQDILVENGNQPQEP
jgi:hypothetical protein